MREREHHSGSDRAHEPKRSFLEELRRREVLQTAGLYAAGAWLLTEILLELIDRAPLADSLRARLGCVVMTVFIAGFPVAVTLAWFFDINWRGISRDTTIARGNVRSAVAGLTVVIAATIAFFWYLGPCAVGRVLGVAVLPCSYYGDPDHDYLGSSSAAEVNDRLAQIPQLRVPATPGVERLVASQPDPVDLARALHIERLVDCGVRRTEDTLNLNFELFEPVHDRSLWARDYEGRPEEELSLLSQAVDGLLSSGVLNVEGLDADRVVALNRPATASPEAWELFQRSRRDATTDNPDVSLERLRQAVRLDPGFARAHAEIARRLWRAALAPGTDVERRRDLLTAAWAYSQRASAADPPLAEAVSMRRTLLASAAEYEVSLQQDELLTDQASLHRQAIALRPSFPAEYLRWAHWLDGQGRRGEARVAREQAAELDPASALSYP